ncbi:HAMP domain-containing sensor histidine kinase [Planococcus sp. N064]|uniref:histidine kinase n=1 Tax=Planococcus liqunii TaxID=3058394 RepID=A0ABT8MTC1_9BACL|nr:HAMP domain-containing sensor histidine kinase [Planococcus sp. N064]MDN7228043.1 HAMP domain-containing sensor histidine kinase [Planococcus sp. N064]
MNLHKRFMLQFFIQLLLLSAVFFVTILTIWAIIGFSLSEQDARQDLAKAESSYFTGKISVDGKNVTIELELKEMAERQNGWLMVVDVEGQVLAAFGAPEQASSRIQENELAAWLLGTDPAGKERAYWKLEYFDEDPVYLLFEKANKAMGLAAVLKPDVNWSQKQLELTADLKKKLQAENAWVQLVDANGEVVDRFGEEAPELSESMDGLDRLAAEWPMASVTVDEVTQTALYVGVAEPPSSFLEDNFADRKLIYVFLLLLLPLVIGTFWYARKFGMPLLVMMQWIQNLGSRQYEAPQDASGQPALYTKKGKLKRKYRLYKDLVGTLEQLTDTLKQHKVQRRELNQTREDWISGLSHDLKTPLSSISGYAQLLEAENYEWSSTEAKEFAGIIHEKSGYMMELLEDLTLTFRLKNNALPLSKEPVELNEFMRRTIIQFINEPANAAFEFDFQPAARSIVAEIDSKWFQRIVDNLIANAVKYNPPGTMITVSLSTIEQHLFIVRIEDDGIGMDPKTLNKLFERYYRGSNTVDSGNGSGLGMAITKQLVGLHGGSIKVTSESGSGTTVRLMVPMQ